MAAFARPKRNQAREIFDAEAVGPEVLLRHWQPGDRFYPIGGPGNVKLQDLFTNSRVPADQRRTRVIACSAAGEIFWVEGLRISERFKITGNSRNTLYWEWERA